jgi:hypothetical protein
MNLNSRSIEHATSLLSVLLAECLPASCSQTSTSVLPAPVDYLSWTQRIAGFATAPQLAGMQNRVLWITANMTPLARQQLTTNGWSLREGEPQ